MSSVKGDGGKGKGRAERGELWTRGDRRSERWGKGFRHRTAIKEARARGVLWKD